MCTSQNLYLDLRKVHDRVHDRDYVALLNGEIGGYCQLDSAALERETNVKRRLSTW